MVDVDVFIEAESSNGAGALAWMKDVPPEDMNRWIGILNHPQIPPAAPTHWNSGTAYVVGDWVLQPSDGAIYRCIVAHTNQAPAVPSAFWIPLSSLRPYEMRIPGAKILTPRRPYSTNVSRTISGNNGAANQIAYPAGEGSLGGAVNIGTWVYVLSNYTGQGNFHRISADSGTVLTVDGSFSPPISGIGGADGKVHHLRDCRSALAAGSTLSRVFHNCDASFNFTAADLEKQVLFLGTTQNFTATNATETINAPAHGLPANTKVRLTSTLTLPTGLFRGTDYYLRDVLAGSFKLAATPGGAVVPFSDDGTGTMTFQSFDDTLRKVVAQDGVSITLDRPLAFVPPTGYAFCVLSGANACHGVAGITSANCVLHDATLHIDEKAPVFLTGLDWNNYNAMPWSNPRLHSQPGTGPDINLTLESQFHWRSRSSNIVIVKLGITAAMISPWFNGQLIGPTQALPFSSGYIGWQYDALSLDFHPSSPGGLFSVLTAMITAARVLIEAAGNKARYRELLIHLFDNDPTPGLGDDQRVARLGAHAALLRDSVRNHVGDSSMPCVFSGPSAYGGDNRPIVYEDLHQVAASDPAGMTGVTNNESNTNYALDGLHFNATGQILLGQDNFATWDPIYTALVEDGNAANSLMVEISNIALSYIGETAKVFSLDTTIDQSTQAQHCAQFYPIAFKHTREAHAWAFATTVKALKLVTKDELRTDWAFAYLPPPDMDSPIRVMSPGFTTTSGEVPSWWRLPNAEGALLMKDDDPNYEVEVDSKGRRVVYTNVESALLKYNKRVNSKTLVPHSFKLAVARKLAALIVGPIRKDPALTERFEALARVEVGDAATIDSNRQQKGPPPDRMPWNRG